MSNKGTFEILILEFAQTVESILPIISSPENVRLWMVDLGWDLGIPADSNLDSFKNAISNMVDTANKIDSNKPFSQELENYFALLQDALIIIKELEKLNNLFYGVDVPPTFYTEATKQIFNEILLNYFEVNLPAFYSFLVFFGIIELEEKENLPNRLDYTHRNLNFNRFIKCFTNPKEVLTEIYNWGMNSFQPYKLISNLTDFIHNTGIPAYSEGLNSLQTEIIQTGIVNDEILSSHTQLRIPIYEFTDEETGACEVGVAIIPSFKSCTQDIISDGIYIQPYIEGVAEMEFLLGKGLVLVLGGRTDISLLCKLTPDGLSIECVDKDSNIVDLSSELNVSIVKSGKESDSRLLLIGSSEESRIDMKSLTVKLITTVNSNFSELRFELVLEEGELVIDIANSDGFISNILSKINLKSNFDLTIGWSSKQGLYFGGSGGLEIKIPSHIELGPIELLSTTLGIKPEKSKIPIEIGATLRGDMGPLCVVIENIGFRTSFSFPDDKNGNFGPLDLGFGFKPPNGVALSIDAEVVKGAGYLFFDTDRGEYAGAMELTFQDFLSLKAIGLISTKMPDGSDGFSMLIIITAEFTIQIGMGFVFLGAGGLLGLHRTAKLTPLAEGVRSGAATNILFPTNVVENAPKIISDIKLFFPIQQNHFLIGPMVKLGYGQPPLISLALGIIIEIKTDGGGSLERIAILGVLKCILPDEQKPVLVLQVNFIGAIDFTKETGFFFASIFESRILVLTIEGEMGLLVAWGNNSNFLVSVGGFHPRFNPPPLPFPVPKRVAISILNKSWGKIRIEGYFAVTTNTVQFGSRVELKFGMSEFKIEGHLAYDALFQFDPFYFIVEISGKVSLKVFGAGVFSITCKFLLEGPTPWRAKGYGKIKILFITFKARFDKKWGSSKNTKLPPIQVMPILLREFSNQQNWEAIAPLSNKILVTVREIPEPENGDTELFVLHPVGKLKVSQRAVPLKVKIDKIVNQKPSDANKFWLGPLPEGFGWSGDVKESFAPAQYFNMKSGKKLSEPATREYIGGSYIKASTGETNAPSVAVRHVRYELITIDTAYKRHQAECYSGMQMLFYVFLRNSAAAKSARSHKMKMQAQPFNEKVNVIEGDFTVANTTNNRPYNKESTNFASTWEAEEFIANHPETAGQVQIIPTNEANFYGS